MEKQLAVEVDVPRVGNIGDLVIDLDKRVVTKDGTALMLAQYEYLILDYLYRRSVVSPGAWCSDTDLRCYLYSRPEAYITNIIKVHVSRLRGKLKCRNSSVVIETMRGEGYRILLTHPN